MKIVVYAYLNFVNIISLEHFAEILIKILLVDTVLLSECFESVLLNFGSSNNLDVLSALL